LDGVKIAVIGAGNVGAASAATMAARGLGRIHLYDAVEGLAVGKAMDINHASPFFHHDASVTGCDSPEELAGADVVVIAAGAPRRAGMSRQDLLGENAAVCDCVGAEILSFCPDAKVLMVTNPVDILTAYVTDRWPEMNVFGLGCMLDTVRLRFLLAEAAGAPVDSVDAMVIGAHNDGMIPLIRHATIGGVAVSDILTDQEIGRVVTETRQAGDRIVSKLKNRGSFYAASHCVAAIVAAIIRDTHHVFPLSVPCRGQYGYSDVCLALPCSVGADGPEGIVELDLNEEEKAALDLCASAVRQALGEVERCCRH
jgi:malate dehydrogenase